MVETSIHAKPIASVPLRSKEAVIANYTPRRHHVSPWTVLRHVVIIFFCVLILFPLIWVLLLSVKTLPEAYTSNIWPSTFDFSHYRYSWNRIPTLRQNYLNSIEVTLLTVAVSTVCAVLAGYALVFLHAPGKRIILALLVASMFFPTRVTAFIGIWDMQRQLHLIDKPLGLIFPYTALTVAISVFIMRGVFESVPKDLVEAAKIDGAGPLRTLVGIMFPIVKNGIVVVIIVNFVAAWGEYLLASRLMNNQENWTLPVVLGTVSGGVSQWAWPRIASVYIMAITPGLIFFAIAQRWYMRGLQEGALKA